MVKEMRLTGVSTKDEANRFLETYLPEHNKRFTKEALRPGDFHKLVPKGLKLDDIFCLKGMRTINNGYVIKWKSRMFAVQKPSITMKGRKIEVLEHFGGIVEFRFNGCSIKTREVTDLRKATPQVKAIVMVKRRKEKYIPPAHHPWRRYNPALH
ncbi:MAG: hypothetical protein WCC06_00520, partial [Candidatus Aminicenantales bacterium]